MKIDPHLPSLALVLLLAGAGAQAQSYRCSNGSSVYHSDRPCGSAPARRKAT